MVTTPSIVIDLHSEIQFLQVSCQPCYTYSTLKYCSCKKLWSLFRAQLHFVFTVKVILEPKDIGIYFIRRRKKDHVSLCTVHHVTFHEPHLFWIFFMFFFHKMCIWMLYSHVKGTLLVDWVYCLNFTRFCIVILSHSIGNAAYSHS